MTIFLDTSAMVKRYVLDEGRNLVNEALAEDPDWCASALVRTETLLCLHRIATGPLDQQRLWSLFRDDWDAVSVVPVDDRNLIRATELGARYGLGTTDAIHLAAADRLPRPVTYLTFDSHQIPAALDLELDVVSPETPDSTYVR